MVNIIGECGTQEELPCNDVLNTIINENCKSEGESKLLVGRRTISTIFTIFYDSTEFLRFNDVFIFVK